MLLELRFALRTLWKNLGFTTAAVTTLALAIGASTVMFSVLYAVLLRPLPYRAPEQLAMLWTEVPSQSLRQGRSAMWNIEEWRKQSQSFADIAWFDGVSATLTRAGEAERISVVRISPNLFPLLGVQPVQGRLFSAEETTQRQRVALISHRFWRTRFDGSPAALGASLELDGQISRIVGVLPDGFQFASLDADVLEPQTMFPDWEERRSVRGRDSWFVVGRLRPGVTFEQAQVEMTTIASRLDAQLPAADRNRGVTVVPLSGYVVGSRSRLALWMLMAAVACVLLIAAANVASLSLARSVGRVREIAIRAALGASSARIVRQLLTENVALACIAGLLGTVLAVAGIRIVRTLDPLGVARLNEVRLDVTVLGWALGASLLTGILVGLAPAVTMWRRNLKPFSAEGGRGVAGGVATRRIRRALVVGEFALAIMLLVGAGLLVRSWWSVERIDPGFRPERVLTMQLRPPVALASAQRAGFYSRALAEIEALPDVESVGFIEDIFISSAPEQTITAEGDVRTSAERMQVRRDEVSGGFFDVLGTRLISGRVFSSSDEPDTPRVAIVNETMARRLWPGRDPVGRRFKLGPADGGGAWFTIVGVVGDMRRQGLENEPVPQMFESIAQSPSSSGVLLIRTSTDDPLTISTAVRAAVHRVDPSAPLYGVTTLERRLEDSLTPRRFQTTVVVAFSVMALLMAAIGIYGLVQYSIATRTQEIGLRMAIGAVSGDIFRMVIGEGLKLSLLGLAVGLIGSIWVARATRSLLFGVTAADPLTFIAVSLLLTAVAIAACYIPARRAMKVEPIAALRQE